MTIERLANSTSEVVVDLASGVPTILHWGASTGSAQAGTTRTALERGIVHGELDVVAPASLLPEHGGGWPGRPGLLGHRARGRHWAPRFGYRSHEADAHRVRVHCTDEAAELDLVVTLELTDVLTVGAELINSSSDGRFHLDALAPTLPLPDHADELLTFDGRWTREFHTARRPWSSGAVTAENRSGRTSSARPPLLFAGRSGFGEHHGEVWGVHLAWSGNHAWLAERLADGRRYLQLGELLHPGEVVLEPGESYRTPDVIAVHGVSGLSSATTGFHRHLRSRPQHPRSPRKVLVNTWEAVYFDHDATKLRALAERAARVGAERFVLDDGWFGSRRDDRSGLGDWCVSEEAHPDGLGPLIDHVRSLGMDFGIWVEPEMVNPDSDLLRAHHEWVLADIHHDPVLGRHQLVLDLTRPEAFEHVLGQLDTLLHDHDIAFVKWDMNRDHVGASLASGSAGTRSQTLAVYRLIDELRARHPDVEIESCSSGGGRIDHEILRRTDRVWTSDCNDALERQSIQRGASMLIPPELMGAHIGPERSHTTGRRHDLSFRAATAMFGHLGIEWNLLELAEDQLDQLAAVVAVHRRFRPLLHAGRALRFDTADDLVAHGVVADDAGEAVVSIARIATASSLTPDAVRLPGLDPDKVYDIRRIELPGERRGPSRTEPAWIAGGLAATGRQLAAHGVRPPAMHPETAILLHLLRRG